MTNPDQANYLLIDGALRPEALAGLYQRHELFDIDPLYLGTRWKDLYDIGPILLKPDPHSTLLSNWLDDKRLREDSTLLYSEASIEQVAEHLRRFICPPDSRGGSGLLRFADPLVAYHWLTSFTTNAHLHLGPIKHWWVATPRQNWEQPPHSAWHLFSGPDSPALWNENHAMLSEDQLRALDRAQYWRFTGRIHAWLAERDPQFFLSMTPSQTSDWLDSSLLEGQHWGLITERAMAIWVEACADYGQDFATQPQGRYQQWLKAGPNNSSQSAEALISAFDTDCHSKKDIPHDC